MGNTKIKSTIDAIQDSDFMELSGKQIKGIREHYQLTQKDFSIKTGININTLIGIEARNNKCSKKTYAKIKQYIINTEIYKMNQQGIYDIDILIFKRTFLLWSQLPIKDGKKIFDRFYECMDSLSKTGKSFTTLEDRKKYWEKIIASIQDIANRKDTIAEEVKTEGTAKDTIANEFIIEPNGQTTFIAPQDASITHPMGD